MKIMERIERKIDSFFKKGEKRYIGRIVEDKRVGFFDILLLFGIVV